MASGQQTNPVDQTPEAVELTRDVLAALVHELGGIASALDLRATALTRVVSENDLRALLELAEQIRMATRAARFAKGGDGFGMLNPTRRTSFEDWWRMAERFTAAVLPRGVTVESQFDECSMTASQSSILTWVWLAGCKEIAEWGVSIPVRLLLKGGPAGTGTGGAKLSAEIQGRDGAWPAHPSASRWTRFSSAMARELGSDPPKWKEQDGTLRWVVEVPS